MADLNRHQEKHISSRIIGIENPALRLLAPRRFDVEPGALRIESLLRAAGFWTVSQIGPVKLDHALLNALIERWRPETHTFHLPWGECTITLEDVALLLGLRVDGKVVTGRSSGFDIAGRVCGNDEFVELMLGVRPFETDLDVAQLSTVFLNRNFMHVPYDADEEHA